jgi:hypothetical protein
MDEKKNQGQPHQGEQRHQGQQHTQPNQGNQGGQQNWNETQNPNRDPAEGPREQQMPGNERTRGTGSSGISNRSMDEEISEQEELPERGSRQSER